VFKGLGDLAALLKDAQQIRIRLEQVREQLARQRVQGTAGGGMVAVEANGQQEILSCRIAPELVERKDREMIEDLVVAAANQALSEARRAAQDEMGKVFGGLPIGGLGDALGHVLNPPSSS
jgi:DNA-binding YbaB/EbfC family protein